jgi:hypothetical protein
MERIEIPAEVYFKAFDGKKFTKQEDCEKYERLYAKWWKSKDHREFEGIEGELCHAHWTITKEDVEEVIWLAHYLHHSPTRNYIKDYVPQWIILSPEYDEYGAITAVRSIEDVKDIVHDTLKAAHDTYSELTKLSWEKA